MENFYLTCASNLFTDKPNHFMTDLSTPLKLNQGEWKVAVTEISIPNSWYNINGNECYMEIYYESKLIFNDFILEGLYTVREFVNFVNKFFDNGINDGVDEGPVQFLLHQSASKILIIVNEDYELRINTDLSYKLGFEGKSIFNTSRLATKPADLDLNHSFMFLNCDLIEESLVTDSYIKLLRPITMTNKTPLKYVNHIFVKPYYKDVKKPFINSIEFELTTVEGLPFTLNNGIVIIILHFIKNKCKSS